jgi:hypothetical protein
MGSGRPPNSHIQTGLLAWHVSAGSYILTSACRQPNLGTVSDINDQLDSGLGALIPRNVTSGRLLDILKLLADAPVLGNIVKPVALLGAWWVEDRKPDRVFDVLVAVREKLAEAEKSQDAYVCKDEFKDLFEETLQRIANEPDENRRTWFKNIILKAIDHPRDHSAHRLFLRLTDELTADAHKVLAILDQPLTANDRQLDRNGRLEAKSGVSRLRVDDILDELVRTGLVNRDRLKGPDPSIPIHHQGSLLDTPGGMQAEGPETYGQHDLSYMFTTLGRDFITYRRG